VTRGRIWLVAAVGFLIGATAGLVIWQAATGRFGRSSGDESRGGVDTATVAVVDSGEADASAATLDTMALSADDSGGRPGMGAAASENPIVLATRQVAPAVVSISVVLPQGAQGASALLMERMGRSYYRNVQSMGSGVIISSDGLVITNYHVVEGATGITVTLSDGQQLDAQLLEGVSRYDLAVLQISGQNLPTAQLAPETGLQIGEWVIAIGSPFGYLLADTQPSVTVGVISALNRDIKLTTGEQRAYLGMIQTDAAINPGNSGGPLVNSRGEVVGINTFIFSESGGSVGIGFAVPASRVLRVVDEVRRFGHYREASLGFGLKQLFPALARYLGLDDPVGALVAYVEQDSPAWKGGLRVYDVLRTINGQPVDNLDNLRRLMYNAKVGDHIPFTAERDGQLWDGEIVLTE